MKQGLLAFCGRRDSLRCALMASLAAYPGMMRRDRERLGLRECRAAWLPGLTVREYRALEAGDAGAITSDLWDSMVEVFGWPVNYWPPK